MKAVNGGHNRSQDSGNDNGADNAGKFIHNNGEERAVAGRTIGSVAVGTDEGRHNSQRNHDDEGDQMGPFSGGRTLGGINTDEHILVGDHSQNHGDSHGQERGGSHTSEIQSVVGCGTFGLRLPNHANGITGQQDAHGEQQTYDDNASLDNGGSIRAPQTRQLGVQERNNGNEQNADNAGQPQGFKKGAACHQLTGHQTKAGAGSADIVNDAGDFTLIAFTGKLGQRAVITLVNEIAEEEARHQRGNRTGDTVSGAGQTGGGAGTRAANDKAVADLSADTAADQQQDATGFTHGQIPIESLGELPAIETDGHHR